MPARPMPKMLTLLALVPCLLFIASCTTAMYGKPKKLDTPNEYEFTIETGGLAFGKEAKKHLTNDMPDFMKEHGYTSYEIVKQHEEFVPSGWTYTVRFK